MAPEILMMPELREENVPSEELLYEALPVDIFSAGVILFVTHIGFFPFMTAEMKDPIFSCIVNQGYEKFWALFESKTNRNFNDDFKELV